MANHPQNSPRGLFAKKRLVVGSDGLAFTSYANSTSLIAANSTGLTVAGGVRLNGARYIRANSTAYLFTAQAAKPSTRTAGFNWTFITNSTGVNGIALRTTATTWKYVSVTSVLPT